MSSIRDLDTHRYGAVLVPEDDNVSTDVLDIPLVAIVIADGGWGFVGNVSNNHWNFWVYGQPTTWANLTDEQRMVVRLAGAWDGQVRDYWVELEYEDEGWYGLEALDQL